MSHRFSCKLVGFNLKAIGQCHVKEALLGFKFQGLLECYDKNMKREENISMIAVLDLV